MGKKNSINQSKLLIPLSYAAILGGSAILIGTSTNLLVNGMMIEMGGESMGIFEFSFVGVPMIIIGIVYMKVVGVRLLPDRSSPVNMFSDSKREYLVEVFVSNQSSLHGTSIEDAGLRNLKGLFLIEIIRNNYHIRVSPKNLLLTGDKLIFAGDTKEVISLIDDFEGLELPKGNHLFEKNKEEVVEVVVSPNSRLQDIKVKQSNFRSSFDAAIVAVHRNGEHLLGKIGNIVLKAGDVLLLYTNDFKNSLDLNLLGIAALSLALGKAIMNSGLANIIAENLINILQPFGMIGLLTGLFIITSLIASYMTNITAVSIVFPIAYSIGSNLIMSGTLQSVIPFVLIVAYGASANYVTPVGYLTNILWFIVQEVTNLKTF